MTRYFTRPSLSPQISGMGIVSAKPARYTGCGNPSGATSAADPRGSARSHQHRPFRHHARLLLGIAPARVAFDAPAASGQRVVSLGPLHGIRGSRMEQREQPVSRPSSAVAVEPRSAPSVISGISARPQPWDRLPPNPESRQQPEGGGQRLGPLFLRSAVRELRRAPQSAARSELDAGRRMRRNRFTFAIDSRARSYRDAERTGQPAAS